MKLSVIIPCYNSERTIITQLKALSTQQWTEPWEVIVVNNQSTDDSMRITRQFADRLPNIHILDAPKRRSRPYARNVGVQAASGQAIAFCDADDEVAPGWVSAMGRALSRHDFVACRIDTEKLNPPWVYAALGQYHPQRSGLQELWYPPHLLHAGGGTLGIKRVLHESISGFDESYSILEDTDYCVRAQLSGAELRFVPEALAYIRYHRTLWSLFRTSRHWAEYNTLVYKKYRPPAKRELWRWRDYLRDWKPVVRSFPRTYSKGCLAVWLWNLGRQLGRLQGSLKHRVPPV